MVYHSLFCYIITSMSNPPTPTKTSALKPILAMLPLGIAVIPWGILAGAMALDAGLSLFQAQLMSLIVFAGAAQIAGIAIFGTNFMGVSSWLNLANSTTLISVRHLLYSASYQDDIKHLPLYKRLGFAFLLTDEMFVVAKAEEEKTGRFDYRFAMITGFVFYVIGTWRRWRAFCCQQFGRRDGIGARFCHCRHLHCDGCAKYQNSPRANGGSWQWGVSVGICLRWCGAGVVVVGTYRHGGWFVFDSSHIMSGYVVKLARSMTHSSSLVCIVPDSFWLGYQNQTQIKLKK